jgi:hypothetical protein
MEPWFSHLAEDRRQRLVVDATTPTGHHRAPAYHRGISAAVWRAALGRRRAVGPARPCN